MANAMVALATITLSSTASTVTFSNIPTTGYRDLRLVSYVPSLTGSPTAQGSYARFNGDSGSNYYGLYAYGNGSSPGSDPTSGTTLFWGAFPAAGGVDQLDILDYAETKHKLVVGRANGNGASTWFYTARWASASAITSIALTSPDTGSDQFGIGSTFSLYGIVS